MEHAVTAEHLADVLAGVAPDVLEDVINSLTDGDIDFSAFDHEDVVEILSSAVLAAAGSGSKRYLEPRRKELRAAIRRALAAP